MNRKVSHLWGILLFASMVLTVLAWTLLAGGAMVVGAWNATPTAGAPQTAADYMTQGEAYFEQGKYTKAITAYGQAIRLDPSLAEAYVNRGMAYYMQDDYTRAIADLDEAIRLEPDNAEAYDWRGLSYFAQGEYKPAIADFSEVIRLDSAYDLAYFYRGQIYYLQEEYDLALADLNEYLCLTGENDDAGAVVLIVQIEAVRGDTFADDFSDNCQSWPTADPNIWIRDGVLWVTVAKEDRFYGAVVPDEPRSDFALTVDAFSATDGIYNYGIWFRRNGNNGYFFMVEPQRGYYALKLLSGGIWQKDLIFWQRSHLIHADAPNQLGIAAFGDRLTLTINGREIAAVTDRQLQTGDIGLTVGAFKGGAVPVEVQFDNLVITSDTTAVRRTVDCADTATTGVPQAECETLVALYTATNGPGWEDSANWNSATPVGTWYGVTSSPSGGHVTILNLSANQLTGHIPDLSALTQLQRIDLSTNQLSGNIPDLSALTQLQRIDLSSNQLTGNVPDLAAFTALHSLNLSNNQFGGNIPELSALTQLQRVYLSNNKLTGDIPDLTGLTYLYSLDLSNNHLASEIPSSITGTIIAFGKLTLCGGDNHITSSDPDVIAWVQARDKGWTQGCE